MHDRLRLLRLPLERLAGRGPRRCFRRRRMIWSWTTTRCSEDRASVRPSPSSGDHHCVAIPRRIDRVERRRGPRLDSPGRSTSTPRWRRLDPSGRCAGARGRHRFGGPNARPVSAERLTVGRCRARDDRTEPRSASVAGRRLRRRRPVRLVARTHLRCGVRLRFWLARTFARSRFAAFWSLVSVRASTASMRSRAPDRTTSCGPRSAAGCLEATRTSLTTGRICMSVELRRRARSIGLSRCVRARRAASLIVRKVGTRTSTPRRWSSSALPVHRRSDQRARTCVRREFGVLMAIRRRLRRRARASRVPTGTDWGGAPARACSLATRCMSALAGVGTPWSRPSITISPLR